MLNHRLSEPQGDQPLLVRLIDCRALYHQPVANLRLHEQPLSFGFNRARIRRVGGKGSRPDAATLRFIKRPRRGRSHRDHPDVHIYPVSTDAGLAQFLADNPEECVQLAVVGAVDADQIQPIVGSHDRALVRPVLSDGCPPATAFHHGGVQMITARKLGIAVDSAVAKPAVVRATVARRSA